ncbi:thiamine pyrophosphate-binding protein [Streptacidiphilus pinicola]|uniref:Thiamine pyrophosphate-binding protein n=1 Tax=Streptacidiphilus pinicola TaxID=2219663 RepID=A0A2X0ILL4_9ACTN|nr:thiamine pyrophosphate-binding protein [Streptacidiphilus pinicola]RAG86004.1 thiamine pyrophosphate-binding protein [Streptacidiphilus pinicola]
MAETTYPSPWHAVVDALVHHGVDTVFGLPGDDLGALHALEDAPVRMLLCRDQRSALFLATGHALQSGRTAVCVVGKGPAVANAVTGLLEAHTSGVPLVVLAGGTATKRRDSGAFQEVDQLALVRPLVKWAARIDHPDRLVPALDKAFLLAASGAPGPVYVELPDDLLDLEIVRTRPWADAPEVATAVTADGVDSRALALVRAARRPVLLVGGGMRGRNGERRIEALADRLGAAVFATASGRGVVDETHPHFAGLAGLYSPAELAPVWSEADLLITLGSRLEETATFNGFVGPGVPVLQVNLDPAGLSTEFPGLGLLGEGAAVVAHWLRELGPHPTEAEADATWPDTVTECRAAAHAAVAARLAEMAAGDTLHVAEVLAALDRLAPADRILVQENGLQDMWSYFFPHWTVGAEAGSVVPSEQTTLGFGTAAAGGVKLAAGDRPVIAFVGDGAFAMVANDIATLAREGVGVTYVVLRNSGYGWLQCQLDQHGAESTRFAFLGEEMGSTLPVHPAAWHAVVRDKSALADLLGEALLNSSKGRVAVLEIPVTIADAPPGITELDGDFPGAATDSAPNPASKNVSKNEEERPTDEQ